MGRSIKGRRFWVGVCFFLVAAGPGCWWPVASVVLEEAGWAEWTRWVFVLPSLCGMLSPLVVGARVDQKYAAEKMLAVVIWVAAFFMFMGYWSLEKAWPVGWFLLFMGLNGLASAPSWSLVTTVTLNSLDDPERDFGVFRAWGTVGWILAGFLVSAIALDASPKVLLLAVGVRILCGFCALMMPHTPPQGKKAKDWREALGLGAFRVLKERNVAVLMVTSFCIGIPLQSFYQHTPLHFADLGVENIAAVMTAGQYFEVVTLVGLGWVLARVKLRWVFSFALFCAVLRYGMNAWGAKMEAYEWLWLGALLHGFVISFFYEAARVFVDSRVEKGMRAQTQALLAMCHSLSVLGGVFFTDWLFRQVVDGGAWEMFWWVLAGMCGLCLCGFLIGYRSEYREKPRVN